MTQQKACPLLFSVQRVILLNMVNQMRSSTQYRGTVLTQFYVNLVAVDFFLVASQKTLFLNLLINHYSYWTLR